MNHRATHAHITKENNIDTDVCLDMLIIHQNLRIRDIISLTFVYHNLFPGLFSLAALRSEVSNVVSAASATVLPTLEDLEGAALALARLQRIYRIPINSLMAGHIAGVSSSVSK